LVLGENPSRFRQFSEFETRSLRAENRGRADEIVRKPEKTKTILRPSPAQGKAYLRIGEFGFEKGFF